MTRHVPVVAVALELLFTKACVTHCAGLIDVADKRIGIYWTADAVVYNVGSICN